MFLLCLYDWCVIDLLPYLVVMQVWLYFFLWWQSHLWILSHPLCISVFMDGQTQSITFAKALRCLSSRDASLISSAAMLSGTSLHDSIALMVICIPDISPLLFVLLLSLDSQSAMNSCGPGLYTILMLYWCICCRILWSLCDRLETSFWNIADISLWSVNHSDIFGEAVLVTLSRPCSMPSAFLFMLL